MRPIAATELIVETYRPRFDNRSAAERLAQAEKFEAMAERFKNNPGLCEGFRKLAAEAREEVRRLGLSAGDKPKHD